MGEELKKINLPQARQVLKYLDNIGYITLAMHKELDDLVATIVSNDEYKKAREEVEAKAQELLGEYNKIEQEITKKIEEINTKFEGAKKKEAKKLRQELGAFEQQKTDEFNKAKDSLRVFQDKRMDTEAREIFVAEVSPDLYEVLERKFYIKDFEGPAKPTESVDTDKLATDVL